LNASLQFTTSSLSGDMSTRRTEYICGHNTRSEGRNCTGHSSSTPAANVRYEYGPLVVRVHNRDLGYSFWLDPGKRIYAAYRVNEHGSPVWLKPRAAQPIKPSGHTLHTHCDTIDTGERRSIFGYSARRVLTKTRQLRDAQLVSESECDGWYIDPPAAWLNLYPPNPGVFCVLSFTSSGTRDDFKFTETGTRETGFLLQSRRIHRSFFVDDGGNLTSREHRTDEEVTEFSESPLKAGLFVPPRDFQRVPRLPDRARYPSRDHMRLRWEMLKDWFSLRGKIDSFAAADPR